MSPTKPIDPRQHVLWHRIRRLGTWGFVGLGGAFLSPLLTCLLFAAVVVWHGHDWSTFVSGATIMWLVTMPIYVGAWFWTWKHMEKRYRATLDVRCPGCGYLRKGAKRSDRCPECGVVLGSI